jgi:hypothetical protein
MNSAALRPGKNSLVPVGKARSVMMCAPSPAD